MTTVKRYTILIRILVILALSTMSLLVGLLILNLLAYSQGLQVALTDMEAIPPGIGGGRCSFSPYYDIDGNLVDSVDVFERNYIGSAPIFIISPTTPIRGDLIPLTSTEAAYAFCGYPMVITPSLLLEGQPFYPLYLTISTPKDILKNGESIQIIASAYFSNYFSNTENTNSTYYAFPITETETVTATFELETTNFSISSGRNSLNIFDINLLQAANSYWIISPDEYAGGNQALIVALMSSKFSYPLESLIHLDVRHPSGLSSTQIALIAVLLSISTLVGGIIAIIKFLPSIWGLSGKITRDKGKKQMGFNFSFR